MPINKTLKKELVINTKPATTTLILLIITTYLIELINPTIKNTLSLSMNNFNNNPLTIITSTLIHANIIHLLYNVTAIFFLSNALEIHTNTKTIIMIYITTTITSGLIFINAYPNTQVIGASGFIYGVIGALIVLKPKLIVLMPIGLISIPAPIIIAGPVIALIEAIMSAVNDGIAHSVHITSLISGVIIGLIKLEEEHGRSKRRE